jgi:CheY-like chemotaxis protein
MAARLHDEETRASCAREREERVSTVLVVDGDPDGRDALRRALEDAGFEVTAASSGETGLGTIGDGEPRVIVSRAHVGDMDAATLISRLREIDVRESPAVIVVADVDGAVAEAAAEAGADRVLTGHVSVFAVVAAVRTVTGDNRIDEGTDMGVTFEGYGRVGDRSRRTSVTGSIAALDVPAVAQALAMGGKTGCLEVATPVGEGAARFDEGRLVHAEFAGEVGDRAFVALVCAAQNGTGHFCFTPVPAAEMATTPRTVHTAVDRLLLTIATGIDEGRLASGASR